MGVADAGGAEDQPPSELLAMSLHRERGAMVVEDVGVLPNAPLVVAEGTVITPSCLPARARAVWILPSADRQERQLLAGDGRSSALYRLLTEEIAPRSLREHPGGGDRRRR